MKRILSIAFALGIMLFFVWLSLRGRDLKGIGEAIAHADFRYLAAYVAILFVVHVVRVIRWGIIVEPIVKASFAELNMLGAVGFMLLVILPLRLGEFGRPFVLADHFKLSKSASLASIVFERIVDGLAMGFMLVCLIWALGSSASADDAAFLRTGAALVTLGFGGLLVVLVFAAKLPHRTHQIVRLTIGRFMPKLGQRVITMMTAFTDGLNVLPSVGKAVAFFGLTAIYWLFAGFGLQLVGKAFGSGLDHLSAMHSFTVLGLQVIGAMIPGGPAGAGTFQWFTQFGLSLAIGKTPEAQTAAAAYANTVWILQFAQQVLYGLFFVLIGKVHWSTLMLGLAGSRSDEGAATPKADEDEPSDATTRGPQGVLDGDGAKPRTTDGAPPVSLDERRKIRAASP